MRNRKNKNKISIIATLSSEMEKKTSSPRKKMFREKRIFLKENLTPQRHLLLKEAEVFAAKKNFKFIWTKNGQVFLRKHEDSSIIYVRCSADLDELAETQFV